MALTEKQVQDLNNMNVAAKRAGLGDILNSGFSNNKGQTISVVVQQTITGEAGTQASVKNSGTDTDVKLVFTIPKGDKGDKGDKGATGAAGKDAVLTPATTKAIGAVKQATLVAEAAGENVTQAEFKALLDALKTAGIMANA